MAGAAQSKRSGTALWDARRCVCARLQNVGVAAAGHVEEPLHAEDVHAMRRPLPQQLIERGPEGVELDGTVKHDGHCAHAQVVRPRGDVDPAAPLSARAACRVLSPPRRGCGRTPSPGGIMPALQLGTAPLGPSPLGPCLQRKVAGPWQLPDPPVLHVRRGRSPAARRHHGRGSRTSRRAPGACAAPPPRR